MSIIGLIASNNFIAVNKDLIKALGLEEAVMIGELASEYRYWEQQSAIDKDGYFYSTSDNVEQNTGLKEGRQRAIVKRLVAAGVISVKVKGLPAKRHFKINEEILAQLLTGNSIKNIQSSTANFAELEPQKQPVNNNNLIIHNNNNKEIYNIVVDYLNEKTGMKYKASSKDTQKHIHARIEEGYTVEDFKTVIDKKVSEWTGTEWAKFLRPSTLFGTKFESYLNAPTVKRKSYGATGVEINTDVEDDLAGYF